MMLRKNPSVAVYIWKDVLGALIGNIVGGWLIGLSLYWFYLHNVSLGFSPLVSFPSRGPRADLGLWRDVVPPACQGHGQGTWTRCGL